MSELLMQMKIKTLKLIRNIILGIKFTDFKQKNQLTSWFFCFVIIQLKLN
jgi:hypothetical protein